ncbi:short-chain dehydrogenase [Curtobacterium sp. MCBD17_034]|uniref:SDR family oxidoreductase n=1 Tax=unclassified Curtobacterium TaxID=257496 RepID=UPI000DA9BD94|nr:MULTISPECIES: SDR family NAD(P)-dependent oxidoreductase [unclassified Curtobacterium]PZF62389.1 short-chain dehydrogenase [Curtobacterium sp. MCBD17_034]PZM39905.1 short-chain dehydrogenase [Curtobacterium sp. MCBD17_031]
MSDDARVLWITGGGTGMGRAAARMAAAAGWRVAVSGRRREALDAVVAEVRSDGGDAIALPVDVTDRRALAAAHAELVDRLGRIDGLVLAAGLNDPARRWADQDLARFTQIVDTNLTAVVAAVDLALPELRRAAGVVVVVSSYSGWQFSPGAGVAYSASKTALGSVVRTLNNQEAEHGVRACHLCPGDVDSDFLAMRPVVPDADARAVMLTPEDVAAAVQFVLDAPGHVRVDELVISPVSQR